jgi:hypothetical protein
MRRLFSDVVKAWEEVVHGRQWRRNENRHLLARGAERLSKRKAAAKRVSIGVFVAEDEDLLVGVDEILDLVVLVGALAPGGGYGVISSV